MSESVLGGESSAHYKPHNICFRQARLTAHDVEGDSDSPPARCLGLLDRFLPCPQFLPLLRRALALRR